MTTSTRATRLAPFALGLLLAAAVALVAVGAADAAIQRSRSGGDRASGTIRYKGAPGASHAYRGGSGFARGYRGPTYRGAPAYRSYPRSGYRSGYLYPQNHNYWRGYRRIYRPRGYASLRIGFGYPRYYAPSYPYGTYCPYVDGDTYYYDSTPRVIERRVVVEHDDDEYAPAPNDDDDAPQVAPAPDDDDVPQVAPAPGDAGLEIDVENLPPAGSYYYDPYCYREFRDLDTYTAHLDREHHARDLQVIERSSGRVLRTLEFDGDVWGVKPQ